MATYTVFCKQSNDTGTTWIGTVEVSEIHMRGIPESDSMTLIQNMARENCADDWGRGVDDIACYCVIKGNVEVLLFEDLSE